MAVTTQHLIDMGQEKDNLLQMSDFGDMGEFLCTCFELFPEEETPEYRYTRWEEIPDLLINREWLCPNFFEIREAMEQLEEPDKDCFCLLYTSEEFQRVDAVVGLYILAVAHTGDGRDVQPGAFGNIFQNHGAEQ